LFKARKTGNFVIRARARGVQAEVPLVVSRHSAVIPENASRYRISSRTGERILEQSSGLGESIDGKKDAQNEEPPVQAELLPGEAWNDNNWPSADDPGNTPGNPPGGPADGGAGSGNFQLSAPVVSLAGRGIDLALNLSYNSRVWNKSGSNMQFDIDQGAPAPGWSLGFGKIAYMGNGGCMLIEADGTRRGYSGQLQQWQSGMTFKGHTVDGSFIDYGCQWYYGNYGSGWSKLPNGTSITYSTIGATPDQLYPTQILDAQGNYLTITYRNPSSPQLDTITDTLGRVVTFQYDSYNRLISVTVPRSQNEDPAHGTGATRVAMRIHYKPLTLNYSFAPGTTVTVPNPTPWVIDSIYYPGTRTGYWFNDADSYSSYGMLTKVIEARDMNWSAGGEAQGTITAGTMTKKAVYNYPLTTANETGRTNGINLSDAPTYTSLKESWAAADVAEDAETLYAVDEDDPYVDGTGSSPARSITITQPNGLISKQYSYNTPTWWMHGLVFVDETYRMEGSTKIILGTSKVSWLEGNQWNYRSHRPGWMEVKDENGHKIKSTYEYGTGRLNQVTRTCDYDNAEVLLKCSSKQYENNADYIGQFDGTGVYVSGRHIFSLVLSASVENPDGTRAARTEYEYDNYQTYGLQDTPGVVQHSHRNNPHTTELENGPCISWDPQFSIPACSYEGEFVWVPIAGGWEEDCDCLEFQQVSVYDPATDKRGNPTKITTYENAQNLTGLINETRAYDMTGNVVKATGACCQELSTLYDDPDTPAIDTQYAYPVSQTWGAPSPSSPHRITTKATYAFNTGSIKTLTNADGRMTTSWYHPDTLRLEKEVIPSGGYSSFVYDDVAMTVTEELRELGGDLADKNKKYLNGLGLERRTEASAPGGIVDIVETKYTKFGEEWMQSRPYRAGEPVYWTVTTYDLLGRATRVTEPNGSYTEMFYNEAAIPDSVVAQPGNRVRVVDAWGRQRWARYDQQDRMAQVVEPNPDRVANPTGSVMAAGSLLTKYKYDTIGRLTESEQGAQIRKFKYDDLGRLIRSKLAEHTATLNDLGQYVGANQPGANWSEAFWFDIRSNPLMKIDPRGVKTHFSYLLGGVGDPLNRLQSKWFDMSGPLDPGLTIHPASGMTYEYEPGGDKTRVKRIRTDGILTEDIVYDNESRIQHYTQTVDYRTTRPMMVSYLYDTVNRIKEVTYPDQYGLAGDPRKIVKHHYDSASRLTRLEYGTATSMADQAGDIVYNSADQTSSIRIGALGFNEVTEEFTYDPQTGFLQNQRAVRNGVDLLNLSYEYDRNGSVGSLTGKTGHVTKIVDALNGNKNREYEYDAVGRLTKTKGGVKGALWSQNYSYDRYGNRTNVTASGNAADDSPIPRDGIPNLSYNNNTNRITTSGFEYDSAGNQTRALAEDGVTWVKFEYDAANRLRVVKRDDAGQTMLQAFAYGSGNARLIDYDALANVNKIFAFAGGTILAEYTEFQHLVPTWTKGYTYLGENSLATMTAKGGDEEISYNHEDSVSIRLVTNQVSGTVDSQAHLPFGTALNAESTMQSNSQRFTTYDRSPLTGLDYAINRTYDSKLGRFTQVDPIDIDSSDLNEPQSLNLYTYCGNDPINHADPDGLFFGRLFRAIGKFFKKLFSNKWFMLAVTIALTVIGIGIAAGWWSVLMTVPKLVLIPTYSGALIGFVLPVQVVTTLGWVTLGLAAAAMVPAFTSVRGFLLTVANIALGNLIGSIQIAGAPGGTPNWNPGDIGNSFALGQPRRGRGWRPRSPFGPGAWASGTGRPPYRPREPRRIPGRRPTRRPDFGGLKDHQRRHAPHLTPEEYFEAALYNIEIGYKVKYYHNGQFKWAYLTQVNPGQFIFTSTNLNGTRIFTHMTNSRGAGAFINSSYLRGLGINPNAVPAHYIRR
jgi:RHS repeat-associated protein